MYGTRPEKKYKDIKSPTDLIKGAA